MCKTINEDSAETKINLYKMWLTSIHDKVTCTYSSADFYASVSSFPLHMSTREET